MNLSILSHSASSKPIGSSKRTAGETLGTASRSVVVQIEAAILPIPLAKKNTAFSKLMARLEVSEVHSQGLSEARQWIVDDLLADEGDTVRTLRLRKNLSQKQFASLLGTTQAQVARIEKGNVDLHRSTCKRLREVLGVSADTLEEMLDRQESIYSGKAQK